VLAFRAIEIHKRLFKENTLCFDNIFELLQSIANDSLLVIVIVLFSNRLNAGLEGESSYRRALSLVEVVSSVVVIKELRIDILTKIAVSYHSICKRGSLKLSYEIGYPSLSLYLRISSSMSSFER